MFAWVLLSSTLFGYELPYDVNEQLKQNAGKLRSFQVRWHSKPKLITASPGLLKSIKRDVDPAFWLGTEFTFRFSDGRYFLQAEFQQSFVAKDGSFQQPQAQVLERLFDGENLYSTNQRSPEMLPQSLHIRPLSRLVDDLKISPFRLAYPALMSLDLPQVQREHQTKNGSSIFSEVAAEKSQPILVEQVELNDKPYLKVILKAPDQETTCFLDPQKDYAIARQEVRNQDSRTQYIMEVSQFAEEQGCWVPEIATVTNFSPPWPLKPELHDTPVFMETIRLEEFETLPAKQTFYLNYAHSGLRVSDERLYPFAKQDISIPYYLVAMNEQELNKVVTELAADNRKHASSFKNWLDWVSRSAIVLNLFLVVSIVCWRLSIRRKNHVPSLSPKKVPTC